ncbi:MAG: ribonucleoside-diphosphate reductase subunit alpha [Planctomycetota bacterium]
MIQTTLTNFTRRLADVELHVTKRDGRVVEFEPERIRRAIEAAFSAEYCGKSNSPLNEDQLRQVDAIFAAVLDSCNIHDRSGEVLEVEGIQDLVEEQLMRGGEFTVAKRYIVYRQERSRARTLRMETTPTSTTAADITVTKADGSAQPLNTHLVKRAIYEACHGLPECMPNELLTELYNNLYNGITTRELAKAMIMVARQKIEAEPAYNKVATRLVLNIVYREAFGEMPQKQDLEVVYRGKFEAALKAGVEADLLDPELLTYDLDKLVAAMRPERDESFTYLGAQTVYDRYLIHIEKRRIETPQYFFMRVAMGLALREDKDKREDYAIRFYELLSTFRFVSATPTLFNSGTRHPQLSSCYLSTVDDDLQHIFKSIGDNAALSKWAGGLGNDWTRVRATGSHIKGTNGESQGVIPFLKIVNDTAVAVNQGGKRKGAVCSYLETWHMDVEEFLDLRKNTGDDRRRTHDMHTANWIPDLFMKRVAEKGTWTLFSPNEVPELHDLYGSAFEAKYEAYERKARNGEMKQHRTIEAVELWRKMLSMVFETGHPWITFKDPSNLRSPQDHAGVVHNSNLCTEILLNTSNDETAVCNLGSVNLRMHTTADGLDQELVEDTVKTAVRMLDNVIDINYYPTDEARNANTRHRPVGLGVMGFQDALFIQKLSYESQAAIDFADTSMELISYHAILASSNLAAERGTYSTYVGSKWDRGMLPIDTIAEVAQHRGGAFVDQNTDTTLDWSAVRQSVAEHGMRNSNVMAIAPTATISNIAGSYQSIEPTYRNLFVKSNLSGDFTIINDYLIQDLKDLGLWDEQMLDDLKYYDGSLAHIDRIPDALKQVYKTAFEIDIFYLIEATSRRQKWIDMGISFNLYIDQPSGKLLNDMYMACWTKGLKTTYYLRGQGATRIEKSTTKAVGDTSKQIKKAPAPAGTASAAPAPPPVTPAAPAVQPTVKDESIDKLLDGKTGIANACSIDNPDCEACQ